MMKRMLCNGLKLIKMLSSKNFLKHRKKVTGLGDIYISHTKNKTTEDWYNMEDQLRKERVKLCLTSKIPKVIIFLMLANCYPSCISNINKKISYKPFKRYK